jgi:hypothetical protein
VGFEPTASASRTQRSTKLSHSPQFRRNIDNIEAASDYFAYFGEAGKKFRIEFTSLLEDCLLRPVQAVNALSRGKPVTDR